MNYGRIRRGPMAGDAFTQIRNVLFRDPNLSFRDKGIFGLISTHRDGFGVTAESIAACSPTDGVSAVKTSLRALEKYGYLKRTRERRSNGTLGAAVYYITDQPELFTSDPELESGRSQPAVPQPPLAEPTQAGPPLAEPAVVDRLHKKTIPLEEDQLVEDEELSLPSVPAQRAAGPAPAEREIVTLIDRPSTAQQVVRAANILTSNDDETAFITWATARYRIRSGALWRTVATNGDLVDWVAAWRAEGCQAVAHGLTGTDATVSGWYALADQPSVTDQRVQQALDLGRQMQAEADARNGGGYEAARTYMNQQAAIGARPYGWEQVPHCGHLDCDEITRYRQTEDADGLRSLSACPDCHPSLRF